MSNLDKQYQEEIHEELTKEVSAVEFQLDIFREDHSVDLLFFIRDLYILVENGQVDITLRDILQVIQAMED